MKAPILLKTILDICFFFLIITFCSAIIITGLAIFTGTDNIPIEINNTIKTNLKTTTITLLFAEILIAGLTVYTIFILRKLIRNFFKGRFYTNYQIKALRSIGRLIIFITLCKGIIAFATRLFLDSRLELSVGMDLSFTSFWFILAIGLFFVYLSSLFDYARTIKEENELTV